MESSVKKFKLYIRYPNGFIVIERFWCYFKNQTIIILRKAVKKGFLLSNTNVYNYFDYSSDSNRD